MLITGCRMCLLNDKMEQWMTTIREITMRVMNVNVLNVALISAT